MGLLNPVAEFIVKEHVAKPLGPKILFIGRQTVPLTLKALHKLLARYGLKDQNKGPVEYDDETRGAEKYQYITDKYFMRSLGVNHFDSLDVTDYEGANLVLDLGEPISKEHYSKYDFIYNGGCFDNMFNPGVALMNLSKFLRPGGRMICMESAASWNSPYLMFSPGWFYDYFVVNKYRHCSVYLASYKAENLMKGPWKMQYVNVFANPNGASPEALNGNRLIILAIAEKSSESTDTVQPVQAQYRATPELENIFRQEEAKIDKHNKLANKTTVNHNTAPYLINAGVLGEWEPRDENLITRFGILISQFSNRFLSFIIKLPSRACRKVLNLVR